MRNVKFTDMSVDALVALFVENALRQDEANLYDDVLRYNRLFEEMIQVEEELERRLGDQRRALIPLYGHRNMQVRLNAAKATLALAPQTARQVLQDIRASRTPQALDAGMTIRNLERGVFKPT